MENKTEKKSDFFNHYMSCLEKKESKLEKSSRLLGIQGKENFTAKRPGHIMTGEKLQNIINNFCSYKKKDFFYLEIGCFTGQTFCSAIYQNPGKFICVDNFSKYGNVKKKLLLNISNFMIKEPNKQIIKFVERNCWDLKKNELDTPIDVYFFDGPHDKESQKNALLKFVDYFADEFIFLVDDFNLEEVIEGTAEGVESIKEIYELVHEQTFEEKGYANYHNGLYVAFFKKIRK